MKKWFTGFLLIFIAMVAVKSFGSNDKNIDYFIQAIRDEQFNQVKSYLDNDKNLINKTNKDGDRAIDFVLYHNEINIEMLKLLLSYDPDLNYVIRLFDMTPLQVVVGAKNGAQGLQTARLLIENGADVNFYTKSGKSKGSVIAYSLVSDRLDMFEMFLKNGADITSNYYNKNERAVNDVLMIMVSKYMLFLKNKNINLEGFHEKPILYNVRSEINSNGYRMLHNKNMKYLKAIAAYSSFSKASDDGLEVLVKWYIKTSEYDALKELGSYGVFKRKSLYNKINKFAIKENNRVAMDILDKYRGN